MQKVKNVLAVQIVGVMLAVAVSVCDLGRFNVDSLADLIPCQCKNLGAFESLFLRPKKTPLGRSNRAG